MSELRIDDITSMLPELDELGPLLDRIVSLSVPDSRRRWAASGELETVGERVVAPPRLEGEAARIAAREAARLERVYGGVVEAVRALADDDRAAAATALLELGLDEESRRALDRAEAYAMAAHRLVRGLRDRRPAALALRRAARAARGRGHLDDAAARYGESYRIARDGGDSDGGVVAAIGRGNISVDRGLWSEAEEWYRSALGLLGDEDGSDGALRRERWQVCLNLSIVRRRTGDPDGSREWLDRAAEVAAALEDPDAPAIVENARGQLLMAVDRVPEAEAALRMALEEARDPKAKVTVGVNLGEALLRQGRTLEAAEVARTAEEEAILGEVIPKLPEVYRLLAAVARRRDLTDAFVFFERALEIIRDRELPEFERAQTLEAYGRLELEKGARERARTRLEEADRIYRELGIEHLRRDVRAALEEIEADSERDDEE